MGCCRLCGGTFFLSVGSLYCRGWAESGLLLQQIFIFVSLKHSGRAESGLLPDQINLSVSRETGKPDKLSEREVRIAEIMVK